MSPRALSEGNWKWKSPCGIKPAHQPQDPPRGRPPRSPLEPPASGSTEECVSLALATANCKVSFQRLS